MAFAQDTKSPRRWAILFVYLLLLPYLVLVLVLTGVYGRCKR